MRATSIFRVVLCLTAAAAAGACTPAASNQNANSNIMVINTNSDNSNTKKGPEPPRQDMIAELEKQAFEAWKNKDSKFFESFLDDKFISTDEKGRRMGKAELVKMVGTSNCNFKDHEFAEARMIPVGIDAVVYVQKVTADYTCGGKKGPSPVASASLYIRSGSMWKGAYHAEVPIQDPRAIKPEAVTSKPAPAPSISPKTGTSPAATGDTLTTTLMSLEQQGWEAWKDGDQKQLEDMTSDQLTLIDPLGTIQPTKDQVMKAWFGENCKINSVNVTDGKSQQFGDDAAILLFKGSADGICSGRPVTPLWGTTILVRTGDTWKPVFVMEIKA